jgi:hypothetical protein
MYLSASKTMDQPELIQLAGRLCVVARDNIQPLLYATKSTCMDLIKSFQIQEELIDRARKSEGINSIGKIMESLPIYTKKFVSKRSLTKKSEFKLNLSTKEEDLQAGGWNKRDMYCSKDVNGGRIISEKLQMSETLERILTKPIQTNSHIQNENATWSDRVQRNENETCISYLKRVISDYIEYDGNENIWRKASDWRKITGICGFESDAAHNFCILTKFVTKGFLERDSNCLTRVNI